MAKFLYCEACAANKKEGTRMCFRGDGIEPSEYERVTWGTAKTPDPSGRFIKINDVPIPLPVGFYICDLCSAEIKPGDRCAAWTVWREDRIEPDHWEENYLVP